MDGGHRVQTLTDGGRRMAKPTADEFIAALRQCEDAGGVDALAALYADGRLAPRGNMSAAEIADWTAAIGTKP